MIKRMVKGGSRQKQRRSTMAEKTNPGREVGPERQHTTQEVKIKHALHRTLLVVIEKGLSRPREQLPRRHGAETLTALSIPMGLKPSHLLQTHSILPPLPSTTNGSRPTIQHTAPESVSHNTDTLRLHLQ